jgi:RNA polymerase sigma-70 factor (family 1)
MPTIKNLSDLELTGLLRKGDIAAFNEIYERYNGLLYLFARKITREQSEAEDLVQEVFINLWDRAGHLQINTSLSSFLYAAVRYKFFDLVAQKKVRLDYAATFQTFIDQGVYSTDEYINERELSRLVEQEVANLPDKMRQVFELSRTQGLSHKDIACELQISEKTVRNHVNHALKILRYKVGVIALLIYFLPK